MLHIERSFLLLEQVRKIWPMTKILKNVRKIKLQGWQFTSRHMLPEAAAPKKSGCFL